MTPLVKVQGAVLADPFSNPGLPIICVVVPPLVETVKETLVLWETPPPLALIVMVDVPAAAVLLAVKVKVELPEPGAAIDVGLNAAVTPAGSPLAESDTAELKTCRKPWLKQLSSLFHPGPRTLLQATR